MASLNVVARDVAWWSVLVLLVASSFVLQIPLILRATRAPAIPIGGCTSSWDNVSCTSSSSSSSRLSDGPGDGSQEPAAEQGAPQQHTLQPRGQAHFGFVQFSAYRNSPRSFSVLGITSVAVRGYDAPVHECVWKSGSREAAAAAAKPELVYIDFDENGALFVPVMVECSFEQEVGGDEHGGTLLLAVADGERGRTRLRVAVAEQGNKEQQGGKRVASVGYAFCGPPIHSGVRAEWILHWLLYHTFLWEQQAHFFFYNVGGLRPHHRPLFSGYVQAGVLTITDVPAESVAQFPSWYYQQVLLANDCLHRARAASADWAFFHDLDEFLHVVPPATLPSLLEQHRDAPWITFGSMPVSHSHCLLQGGRHLWPVQRMWWRNAVPECMHQERDPWSCIQAPGRRKYVVNPRKVMATGVHRVAIPAEGGVDLSASVARIHHYHGVLSPTVELCHHSVNLSHPMDHLDWLMPGFANFVQDSAIATALQRARCNLIPVDTQSWGKKVCDHMLQAMEQ